MATRLTNVSTGVVVNVDAETAHRLGAGWVTDDDLEAAQQAEADRVAAVEAAEQKAEAERAERQAAADAEAAKKAEAAEKRAAAAAAKAAAEKSQ